MTLVLTPLASDALTATANPLNPANWTTTTGAGPLQVTGGHGAATVFNQFDAEFWSARVFPNDQYCSVSISAAIPLGSNAALLLGVRCSADSTQGYFVECADASNTAGHLDLSIITGVGDVLFDIPSLAYSVGDVFTIAVVGTTVYALQNGVQVGSVVDSQFSSGLIMLGILDGIDITDVRVNNFVAGGVTIPSPTLITLEFQGLRFKMQDNGDGTFSISTHTGGAGVADQTIEIQGSRILAHDNGDGTFSLTTTTSTGATDISVEWQGLRLKLHPTGGTAIVDGVSVPTYAIVVNAI